MPTPEAAGSGVSEAPVLTLKRAAVPPRLPPSSHSPTAQRARQALVSVGLSLSPVPFCGEFRDTRGRVGERTEGRPCAKPPAEAFN